MENLLKFLKCWSRKQQKNNIKKMVTYFYIKNLFKDKKIKCINLNY